MIAARGRRNPPDDRDRRPARTGTATSPIGRPPRATLGRPPLSAEDVRSRVTEYCERYGVEASDDGLPPFPSGRRETPQHREWLTVYRAVRRLQARTAAVETPPAPPEAAAPRSRPVPSACPVCGLPLPASAAARELRLGLRRTAPRVRLHEPCADLAELARKAGPEVLARLAARLWPPANHR